MNAALTLTGDGYSIVVAPEAAQQKADILEQSKKITSVATELEVDMARLVLKRLAGFRNEVERSRKLVKEPVLKVGKAIDERAVEFVVATTMEETRLDRLVSGYAQQQESLRREAERKAREEVRKAEETKLAEERARIAAEKAQADALDAALGESRKEQREAEAKRLEADRAYKDHEQLSEYRREQEALAERAKSQIVAPVKGTKSEWDYEVTNILYLFKAHPQLVELTPKRREILEYLKRFAPGTVVVVPGLKIIEKFTVNKR